ncbi:MAG TPA: glycosyltransferase family 2 protein [Bryobacteraceae bacterium]|jgi:dolichol-phosphate mannosyltransferase|nr:glycosyltransferase family 2 protein [Bryobacteraceae bacterium]
MAQPFSRSADEQTKSAVSFATHGGVRYALTQRDYPRRLSIVVPLYNEEESIGHLRSAMEAFFLTLATQDVELLLVNDGSSDRTIDFLYDWARFDPRVKVISLSRNFGHQVAATAGLDHATGDAIVLIDADLQDPPDTIHDMIARYCEGYDVAYGQRISRAGEGAFKRATAWLFYRLMKLMVYRDLQPDVGDFRLISRRFLDTLVTLRELHRFLRGMGTWVGYSQIAVPYARRPRVAGETKYPLRKMIRLAWTAATSFSILPLKLTIYVGFAVALVSLEEFVRALVGYFKHSTVDGWTSLMVAVTAIGGVLLISVGLLGEYVGKVYEESKGRPLYIVATKVNIDAELPPDRYARR